jgi:hypothetical protein
VCVGASLCSPRGCARAMERASGRMVIPASGLLSSNELHQQAMGVGFDGVVQKKHVRFDIVCCEHIKKLSSITIFLNREQK